MKTLVKALAAIILVCLIGQATVAGDALLPKQVEDAIQSWLDSEWGEGTATFIPATSPRLMHNWSEQTIKIEGEKLPRGLVVAQVDIFEDGRRVRRIPVSLRVKAEAVVPVAVRTLSRGETLYKDMIRWEKREVSDIRDDWPGQQDVLTDGETWLRRTVRENDVVTKTAFERKPDVLRGDVVTLLAQKGNVSIETQGVAIEDGNRGDVIRVENTEYRRILRAEIIDRATAVIQN